MIPMRGSMPGAGVPTTSSSPGTADLGSTAHAPLEPALGSYVLDRDPPRPAGERPAAARAGGPE